MNKNYKSIVCTCSRTYGAYKNSWDTSGIDFDYLSHKINDTELKGLIFTEEDLRKDYDFNTEVSKKHYWNSHGNRNIVWFYAHLRMVYYYQFNPGQDYYWFFDDDLSVDNWEVFFDSFKNNNSDFISYYGFKEESVKSQPNIPIIDGNSYTGNGWFDRFPGDKDILYPDNTELFGSFFPAVRFSNSALKKLNDLLLEGIYGYSEGFVPTILNYFNYSLDTIFDNKSQGKYFDNDIVNVKHKNGKIDWSWI